MNVKKRKKRKSQKDALNRDSSLGMFVQEQAERKKEVQEVEDMAFRQLRRATAKKPWYPFGSVKNEFPLQIFNSALPFK